MSVRWTHNNRNMARGTILNFNPSLLISRAPRCSPCGRTAPCSRPGRGCPDSNSPPPADPPVGVEDIAVAAVVVVVVVVAAVAVAGVVVDVVAVAEFAGGRSV